MSEHMPLVPRHLAVCTLCGQATFHIRGICRTCDPCTAALLAAADAGLSADRTPELAAKVAEHPDARVPVPELSA